MQRLYIANRGEIACRVIRTARDMSLTTIVGYSEADAGSLFVEMADEHYLLGPAQPAESYLNTERILAVLSEAKVDAVHPGYGFLSENSDFARSVMAAGITWIGPSPDAIDGMGDKERARQTMAGAGVPLVPGHEQIPAFEEARRIALEIGYPVLIKAALGGGGIGMKIVEDEESLRKAWQESGDRARRAFGSGRLYLEKLITGPHHIEVQMFGDVDGAVYTIFERECSVQRRHQKVIEESPSPFVTDEDRQALYAAAIAGAERIDYRNAGTMEFLLDADHHPYFLEVNTRLQVEHPVTEMVSGLDLVALQLKAASGDSVASDLQGVVSRGHAIELRLYAENPKNFYPAPGRIEELIWPKGDGIRVDTGVRAGDMITPFYDPMIAKIIGWGNTREQAIERLETALETMTITGLKTNLPFLQEVLACPSFRSGTYNTGLLYELRPKLRGKA